MAITPQDTLRDLQSRGFRLCIVCDSEATYAADDATAQHADVDRLRQAARVALVLGNDCELHVGNGRYVAQRWSSFFAVAVVAVADDNFRKSLQRKLRMARKRWEKASEMVEK